MIEFVLCFSGRIASGKTSISRGVAESLLCKYASFGEYIRYVAVKRGLDPNNRKVLQDVGQEQIDKGWSDFCKSLLEFVGWNPGENLIIDGIRHQLAVETIRDIARPINTYMIFIDTNEQIRQSRLQQRGNGQDQKIIENHPVEIESKSELINNADLVVDGALPLETNIFLIKEWLAKL
jgi:dephospho-CoA kinase